MLGKKEEGEVPGKSIDKNLKGVAGVHLVVAQLSLKGFVALPTTRNLKSFDVVACLPDLSKTVFLQIKSTNKPRGGWAVYTIPRDPNKNWQKELKEYVFPRDNFFYVFVELLTEKKTEPTFYIVPSKDVVNMLIKQTKEAYGKNFKPGGQLLCWGYGGLEPEVIEKYQDKWKLLFA
jgi:hypothetical protein